MYIIKYSNITNRAMQSYYKKNRLKPLSAFCTAAQLNSISKAANKLGLSQPSVSLQIQALEREFKQVLFERKGPNIKLTYHGEFLYRMAMPLVDGIDSLHKIFEANINQVDQGSLQIAAGESTILNVIAETTRTFITQYPKVKVRLHNVNGKEGLQLLRHDKVDIAVGPMLDEVDDINYEPIVEFAPVLICYNGHPLAKKTADTISLDDIKPYPLILPPHERTTTSLIEMVFGNYNIDYNMVVEVGGWEVIKKYVAMKMGISIVTDICLLHDTENVISVPLTKYFSKRSYGIILRKGKFISPQTEEFIRMLKQKYL